MSQSCSECKVMYKKVCCKCEIFVLIFKAYFFFLTFAQTSPSSDRKVPDNIGLGEE